MTALIFTMADCVLDANVLVAWIDSADSLHVRAHDLRRIDPSTIQWVGTESERLYGTILDQVAATNGRLNFNDAFIAILQKEGRIGRVATFDSGFDVVPGFMCVPLAERTRR